MRLPVPLDLLKLAQEVRPPKRHYFAFFRNEEVQVEHVLPGRFGTLTEVEALARWLSAHPEIRSILVVSSPTHLRRLRLCCRALLSPNIELAFLASPPSTSSTFDSTIPNVDADPDAEQPSALASPADDLLELFKVMLYWALLRVR
jgi:hypothetical protein